MGQDEVEEAIFMQSFMPRTLNELRNYEEDHSKMAQGDDSSVSMYLKKATAVGAGVSRCGRSGVDRLRD